MLGKDKKSANSRFFSFALGAFAFFRAFFSSRFRAFFLASRSQARKREKSPSAQLWFCVVCLKTLKA
jgi:sterol desaturase/sphingolipid hydroxylase (fatty acid hydroxylase superfamily)